MGYLIDPLPDWCPRCELMSVFPTTWPVPGGWEPHLIHRHIPFTTPAQHLLGLSVNTSPHAQPQLFLGTP